MSQIEPEQNRTSETGYLKWLAVICALLAIIPALKAFLLTPAGNMYLGVQYNLDDHMVYAAWMRQAMSGHFLFDNRFAIDHQPTLTIHVFFFLLGLVAKFIGIPVTVTLARLVFTVLFVFLCYRLVSKVTPAGYTTKLAMTLVIFGGGVGFLVWHNFGVALTRPEAQRYVGIMMGSLPTDVWQPEGYVFPSMLTSALFMVSLCLILGVLLSVLEARNSPRAVLPGFLCMAALMNIHSYDVLMVTLVLIGFLIATLTKGQAERSWVLRAVIIGAGAIIPALWFLYVLRQDPVFQARAATLTYAPNFRQVIFGYLPLLAFGMVGLGAEAMKDRRRLTAVAGLAVLLLTMFLAAQADDSHYWMTMAAWGLLIAVAYTLIALLANDVPAWNLVVAWAITGLFAPYLPELFQRKLAMGLAIPWAILAAVGVAKLVMTQDRGARNLMTVLGIVLMCGTSARWMVRELELSNLDVSNTTVHAVYASRDTERIMAYLNQRPNERAVVLAMPGVASPGTNQDGSVIPDSFDRPYLPDLNPVLAGMTGVYAYAGHWSETPDYIARRNVASTFFLQRVPVRGTPQLVTDDDRRRILALTHATYIVAPVPQTFPALNLDDVSNLGQVLVNGNQFRLIQVTPP